MPQREGKMCRAAEFDRASKDFLWQVKVDRLGKHEPHKAAVRQAGNGFLGEDFSWLKFAHVDSSMDWDAAPGESKLRVNRARRPRGPRLCDWDLPGWAWSATRGPPQWLPAPRGIAALSRSGVASRRAIHPLSPGRAWRDVAPIRRAPAP